MQRSQIIPTQGLWTPTLKLVASKVSVVSSGNRVGGPPGVPAEIRRGEIWWANLGEPSGSEPGYRRPVIVVSSDLLNASRLRTVMVVPLTTTLWLADVAGHVALRMQDTGLRDDSVALTSQVVALDRGRLDTRVIRLRRALMATVDAGLRLALDLD
jgi:mRNA interferase MazF